MPDETSTRHLESAQSALILIDMQEKLLPPIYERERVLRNAQLLLRLAGILKIPTLLTSQYAKGLGAVVPEITALAPVAPPLDKTSFGCFGDPNFSAQLKRLAPEANTLLIAGIESHICVAQTVLGAIDSGYIVHVAADAVSSRTEENWRVGLNRMERAGAVISSTEMMIYELLGQSGTPAFKSMLQFLK